MKRLKIVLALLVGLAMFATACGSDALDDVTDAAGDVADSASEVVAEVTDDDESEPEAAEAEPEEAMDDEPEPEEAMDDEPDEAMVDEPAGEPIVIGFIGGSAGEATYQSSLAGVEAGIHGVNARGGVDGRPLELVSCRDELDPNLATECMQSLIDDGAVVMVGDFQGQRATTGPLMLEQGYSTIGGFLLTGGDMAIPGLFASNGGAFVSGAGQATACAAVGAQRIASAYVDVEAGAQLVPLIAGVLLPPFEGAEQVEAVPLPLGTADYAPVAAKLLESDPECILGLSGADQITPLFQALIQAGYEGILTASGAAYSPAALVEIFGDDAEGMILPGVYDPESAGWDAYLADQGGVRPGVPGDDIAASAWLGVQIAADVIGQAGTDPAAITAAIPEVVVNYDTDGLTAAPLDWSIEGTNPLGQPLINLRNSEMIPLKIEGGIAVPQSGWIDFWSGQPVG